MKLMKKIINEPLKMNLQEFAENGAASPGDGNPDGTEEGNTNQQNQSTEKVELTQSELDRKIESESDRKLDAALKRKQKEWNDETDRKIQEALKEKDRLAQLSDKEKKEEELSSREQELNNRLAEIERKELRSDAVETLTEKGLSSDFADFVLGEDAEKTLENINAIKKVFDESVNNAVKEKLRQDTPPAGGAAGGNKVHSIAAMRNEQDKKENQAPNPWATQQ